MDAPLHLLAAGAGNTGKTSLLLTMARGVYLADPPKRFEGWTIAVPLPDAAAAAGSGSGGAGSPKKSKVLRTRSHGGSNNSVSEETKVSPTSDLFHESCANAQHQWIIFVGYKMRSAKKGATN